MLYIEEISYLKRKYIYSKSDIINYNGMYKTHFKNNFEL